MWCSNRALWSDHEVALRPGWTTSRNLGGCIQDLKKWYSPPLVHWKALLPRSTEGNTTQAPQPDTKLTGLPSQQGFWSLLNSAVSTARLLQFFFTFIMNSNVKMPGNYWTIFDQVIVLGLCKCQRHYKTNVLTQQTGFHQMVLQGSIFKNRKSKAKAP